VRVPGEHSESGWTALLTSLTAAVLPTVASTSRRVAILSTYPPTQCGLATFTAALQSHLGTSGFAADVVRVVEDEDGHYGPEVIAQLVNGSASSALGVVRLLNAYDAVVVQHEYGIYGGPDGADVLALLDALSVPVVVVFHTVLQEPTQSQRAILERLLRIAAVAVTMTETARARLISGYGAHRDQVTTIPHGAERHLHLALPERHDDRPLVLTWGLLGPGKGIEWAIDALTGLADLSPRYLVLGKTHPKVAARHGEAYRDALVARAQARGVSHLVEFDDSYLPVAALASIVATAQVVLLPYDSKDQVTSGVLTEAVAAGRPVVSTSFPHAVELLQDGPGLVVPQGDSVALAQALRRVLTDEALNRQVTEAAVRKAPELYWSAVAGRYRDVVHSLTAALLQAP
jgi:polysaccharide biosynthesis protein PslF